MKIAMLVLLLAANVAIADVTYNNVSVRHSTKAKRLYCTQVGNTAITITGRDGAKFSTRKIGRSTAVTSLPDRCVIRITFDPPVMRVKMLLSSDIGFDESPPIVVCYGRFHFGGRIDPVWYRFGPGLYHTAYSATGQFDDWTPLDDDFIYTHCEWVGTASKIAFVLLPLYEANTLADWSQILARQPIEWRIGPLKDFATFQRGLGDNPDVALEKRIP